jgi:hypothetical protein
MKTTLLLFGLTTTLTLAQGDLNPPPGGPTATMKALDQLEAHTPIPKTSGSPIAGPHFIISQPGSYYLTGNVEVASGDGIVISADAVTLDLNGFSLISTTVANPASGSPIFINARSGIQIKNGQIQGATERTFVGPKSWEFSYTTKGWKYGIFNDFPKNCEGANLSFLIISAYADTGIYQPLGSSIIQSVSATGNGGKGITVGRSTLSDINASYNRDTGISASFSNISKSTISYNQNNGINGSSCSMNNITAFANGSADTYGSKTSLTNSISFNNEDNGINCHQGVVAHCIAYDNSFSGSGFDRIYVNGGQRISCMPASE